MPKITKIFYKGFTPPPLGRVFKWWQHRAANHKISHKSYTHFYLVGGFTIVELLVVLAIIALLSSIVLAQLQSSRAKARDAQREQDMKTFQNALAIYATNQKNYPVYTGALTGSDTVSNALINASALSAIPKDPLNTGNYVYQYSSTNGSTYTLTYYLETGTIPGKSAGQNLASP